MSKFNPEDGKMTVVDGQSAYVAGEYKVLFGAIPQGPSPNTSYLRLQYLIVLRDNKRILAFVISQRMSLGNGGASVTYSLERLEETEESFTLWTFPAYPDHQVAAVRAIELAVDFEKNALAGMDPAIYDAFKSEAIEYLRKIYPQGRFFDFRGVVGPFIVLQFQPEPTFKSHYIGLAFNPKKKTYHYLTTTRSLEKFLEDNRIELAGDKRLVSQETLGGLIRLFMLTGVNSYSRFVVKGPEDAAHIFDSPYCTDRVREEFPKRFDKIAKKMSPPRVSGGALHFATADYAYPSLFMEWRLSESKGKVRLEPKVVLDSPYLPDFLLNDPTSPEAGGLDYIR